MTGLFIALMALMSFGFGLIFRNTAAAIAAFVGVVFVLPLVMHGISESAVRYLPTNILTNSIMATVNQGPGGDRTGVAGRRVVADGCSMPRSPSPSERCSSSGETLERARRRGRLGADPDPRRASRAGQASGPD